MSDRNSDTTAAKLCITRAPMLLHCLLTTRSPHNQAWGNMEVLTVPAGEHDIKRQARYSHIILQLEAPTIQLMTFFVFSASDRPCIGPCCGDNRGQSRLTTAQGRLWAKMPTMVQQLDEVERLETLVAESERPATEGRSRPMLEGASLRPEMLERCLVGQNAAEACVQIHGVIFCHILYHHAVSQVAFVKDETS